MLSAICMRMSGGEADRVMRVATQWLLLTFMSCKFGVVSVSGVGLGRGWVRGSSRPAARGKECLKRVMNMKMSSELRQSLDVRRL